MPLVLQRRLGINDQGTKGPVCRVYTYGIWQGLYSLVNIDITNIIDKSYIEQKVICHCPIISPGVQTERDKTSRTWRKIECLNYSWTLRITLWVKCTVHLGTEQQRGQEEISILCISRLWQEKCWWVWDQNQVFSTAIQIYLTPCIFKNLHLIVRSL